MPKIQIISRTEENGKNNEDALYVGRSGNKTVLLVCDGVGGTDAGEIASGYVTKNLEAWIKERDLSRMGAKTLHSEVASFIESMHEDLTTIAEEKATTMGTTLVLAVIGKNKAVIESVGDSRAYVCQRGYLKQITIDQTVRMYELVTGETLDHVLENKKDSTLMQCIGDGPKLPEPASYVVRLDDDVDILLCSDGLSNKLNELNFQSKLKDNSLSPEEVIDELISLAIKRGEKDNITAVLYRRRK